MLLSTEKGTLMIQQHPFTAFIDLIDLDQKMRIFHNKINTFQLAVLEDAKQKKELVSRFDQFKIHLRELKKVIDDYELEIKDLDAKEKRKKEQLDALQNPKEYQPLKKEIDRLKKEQHGVESQLMAVWNKMELAQKDFEVQQVSFDSKIKELENSMIEKQEAITSLKAELDALQRDRPVKEALVPQEWLEKYSHMRMQVADPVVPVLSGGCSACFYNIPNHEIMRLKRRAVIQCKGCFRLIYMQEAMEDQSPEENQTKASV